jgi:hypothetical protein
MHHIHSCLMRPVTAFSPVNPPCPPLPKGGTNASPLKKGDRGGFSSSGVNVSSGTIHKQTPWVFMHYPGRSLLFHEESHYPRRSLFSLRQPLLEPWALFPRPVALAVSADGHVLAARGKTVMADRGLFCLRFTGLLYIRYFGHDALKNIFDGLVKNRHTRESGYPESSQPSKKTGFPFSRE